MEKNERLTTLRHSCEHVLMQAMENLYPGIIKAMGPATDEGFYFDFDPSTGSGQVKISEEDFPKIEAEMLRLKNLALPISQITLTAPTAQKLFKGNPYKLEWIREAVGRKEKLTAYWTGEPNKKGSFVDLCKGPHLNSTAEIGVFKLLSVAGAYWRGSEKNKMLTRIYGTAFETKEELDKYLWQIEEAKKRDHRKLGAQLGLWVFSDLVGAGLPLFTQKGALIRRLIIQYVEELQSKQGIAQVWTPQIVKAALFKISGHYDKYRDNLFAVKSNYSEEEFFLKPMNCPQHTQIYTAQSHSYKDLPIRMSDFAMLYRDEKPGELLGLARVRAFSQDDCHIFCREDQVIEEINKALDMTHEIMTTYGFTYRYRLSLRDPKHLENYISDEKIWQKSEKLAREILEKRQVEYFEGLGEAVFYGPKLDLIAKDVLGREWQLSTLQIDYFMPERFNLTYTDSQGKEQRPVMLHRAISGSPERLMMVLLEHFAGALPVWLCPTQAQIIPISEKHNEYAITIQKALLDVGIRTEVDLRSETMQAKIRDAQTQKIPYMLIVGDKEVSANTVSVRLRDQRNFNGLGVEEFVGTVQKLINGRSLDIWP